MKQIFIVLLIFILSGVINAQLFDMNAVEKGDYDFTSIASLNSTTAYLGATDGMLFKTVDGGLTWALAYTEPNGDDINNVQFLNEQLGLFCCDDGHIYKTTDGGNSWTDISFSTDEISITTDLNDILILDENHYWIVGNDYEVAIDDSTSKKIPLAMETTDGGETYTLHEFAQDSKKDAYGITSSMNGQVIIIGYSNGVVISPDGGTTWTLPSEVDYVLTTYSRSDVKDVLAIDNQTVMATGYGTFALGLQNTPFLKSSDGGITWENQIQDESRATYCYGQTFFFENETIGYLGGGGTGYGGLVQKTTDAGTTWEVIFSCPDDIKAITKLGDRLIVAGDNSNLWYCDNGEDFYPLYAPVGAMYGIAAKGDQVAAGGWNGYFLVSENSGQSYQFGLVKSGIMANKINCCSFTPNSNRIWAAGSQFVRNYSDDNGLSWEMSAPVEMDSKSYIEFMKFIDDNTIIAGGGLNDTKNDIILKSTDGGATWDTVTQGQTEERWISCASKDDFVMVGGRDGNFAISEDKGENWTYHVLDTNMMMDVRGVGITSDKIFICGDDGQLYKSGDNAQTWEAIELDFPVDGDGEAIIKDLYFMVSDGDKILVNEFNTSGPDYQFYSNDNGATWKTDSLNAEKEWYYSAAVSNGNYFFACNTGAILKKNYETGIQERYGVIKKSLLASNYPNPFNPSTVIEFSLNKNSKVSVEIFNSLGQKVETLVKDQPYTAGKHKVKWEASQYSTGVYFYKVSMDGSSSVKKMTLMK